MKGRVFVGLSGGVDSAVSAALLQRDGYDVTGVFIKIWQPEFMECTWREDRLSAMRVAAYLGMPFREVDLSDEYKRMVVDGMLAEYTAGRTPNPDIACNEYVKFGAFFAWARGEGAEYVATGHYAQIVQDGTRYALARGADPEKDQSYFLSRVSADVLPYVLFPIGGYTKQEVRALARSFGLPNAARPDSQGLCFVGDVHMDEFLSRLLPVRQGAVLTKNGATVGAHAGAILYTIGQRHGFSTTSGGPWYVVGTDVQKNTITVSEHKEDCAHTRITLTDMLWYDQKALVGQALAGQVLTGQVRYRDSTRACTLEKRGDNGALVTFSEPVIVSPGQSVVGYVGKCVAWSGIVASCA